MLTLLYQRERKKAAEKEAARKVQEQKKLEKLMKGKTPPQEMFINPDMYSKYDDSVRV
jgi:hypothetical protein